MNLTKYSELSNWINQYSKSSPRVAIIGLPGSGKTTLAKKVAEKNQIKTIHGDILWKSNPEKYKELVLDSLNDHKAWIFEGKFFKVKNQLLGQITHLIYLSPPKAKIIGNLMLREVLGRGEWPLLNPENHLWFTLRHFRMLNTRNKTLYESFDKPKVRIGHLS